MNERYSTGDVLVVFSARDVKVLELLRELLSSHPPNTTWFVFDRKTMEMLARTDLIARLPSDRVIVFSGRNLEETVLRIYAVSKPAKAYICDSMGSMKPLADFLRVTTVEIKTC